MTIPDSVYGSLVTLGAMAVVWIAKMFIQQQVAPPPPQPRICPPDIPAAPTPLHAPDNPARASHGPLVNLSARDWLNITAAIQQQFNGRYWLASEARDAMKEIRAHAEGQELRLHARISKLGDEMKAKFDRFDDEMKEKADKE